MTDTQAPVTENVEAPAVVEGAPSELETLQARATKMGLKFRSNTGVEKLKSMIEDALAGNPVTQDDTDEKEVQPEKPKKKTRQEMKKDALKLVRVKITCMNPNKKNWPGEVMTVSNSIVSVKRFVPFNTGEPTHVEQIILNAMRSRQYSEFVRKKGQNGVPSVTSKLVDEFAIQELPQLNDEELKELARRQALSGAVE